MDALHASRKIHDYAARAGLGDVHIHLLRHSFGTIMIRKTNDLYLVQQAMGHANVTTTMGYLRRARQDDVRDAVDRVFG